MDRIFRIGKITKISGGELKVLFEDVNIESGWLKVVELRCNHICECEHECECKCKCSSEHKCVSHREYKIGDYVLCAYNLGFNEQGFVLGVLL